MPLTRSLTKQLTRKQVYRRRRVVVFGAAATILATLFYLPLTLLAPIRSVSAAVVPYSAPKQVAVHPSLPSYGASGIGAVGYPDLLAQAGTGKPRPIASITKIITSLVVLDTKPLKVGTPGPLIPFAAGDVAIYSKYLAENGVVAPVPVGQRLSQTDVMTVMLLRSANNYAWSLAHWAYGSEQNYLVHARSWLKAHGLTSTTLLDTNGLNPGDTSTPADLIAIGKLALADPVLSKIISTRSVSVPFVGKLTNSNGLLGVDGIDGIKTGTTGEAGACLLFSAEYTVGSHAVTVVGVVLGGPDHATINAQIRRLLRDVRGGFHEVTLAAQGQQFGHYRTAWGDTADAVAASKTTALVWTDTPITALVQPDPVSLSQPGDSAGSVTFRVGLQTVKAKLTLDKPLNDPGAWWRLTHPAALF